MKGISWFFIIAVICTLVSCADKTQVSCIVQHTQATANEKLAAKEIQRYIYLRTGKLVPVKEASDVSSIKEGSVVIGLVFAGDWLSGNKESFFLKEEGNKLYVAGNSDVATLYAAYRFAEIMGVRFYMHGDVIPDERIDEITIKGIDESHNPLFQTRGLQPFHDFPEGPDWWSTDAYKAYFSQMVKMRLNFFGLHTYPENGPHAEPSVWIGLKEDVKENGDVTFSYRSTYANTEREGHWGYAPMKTSDFTAGASLLFEEDIYGNDVLKGLTATVLTPEQSNEVFNRQGKFFNEVFTFGRQYGLNMTVGLETPLRIPQDLKKHLQSKGMNPDSPETTKSLYEGIYHRINKTYPIDYFWLWTPEDWTWGNPDKKTIDKTFKDIDIASKTLEESGSVFGFGLCGWVLGPPDNRSAFDNTTPDWVAISCINRHLGFEWVDPGFRTVVKKRPKWVIPWLEDDHAMIQPQFWVGRVRRDAADALADNCTGLIGIHWRTNTIAHNIAALAQAGWEQKAWNADLGKTTTNEEDRTKRDRDLPASDFYTDWIKSEFGENTVVHLLPVFEKIDGGIYIPENAKIANLPRPTSWDIGPGGIMENRTPWEEEQQKYAFIGDLESFRTQVSGNGNLYRYDYWLAQFNYLRQLGKIGCTRGLLAEKVEQLKKASSQQKQELAEEAVKIRIQLSREWEQLMTALLEAVCSVGEMGNVANLEQHNRTTLKFLTGYDEEIKKLTGKPLPESVNLSQEYTGKSRFFVPTVRSLLSEGETLELKTIVLSESGATPVAYYRNMGQGDYNEMKMQHVSRGVYRASISPDNGQPLEYYIKVTYSDGTENIWPATAPSISQTVLIN